MQVPSRAPQAAGREWHNSRRWPVRAYNVALPSPSECDHLRVVLVSTRNPLNMGAAARAMSNFGFLRLRVVKPHAPSFREARSAMAAAPVLAAAEEYASVAEAVADCTLVVGTTAARKRELHHPVRPLREAAPLIRRRLKSGRVALLFGSEKRGLLNEDLAHCHWLIRIPTREEHSSMNLGQAVAVCLYELQRDVRSAPRRQERAKPATSADVERATEILLEALQISGYINPRTTVATTEKVRRLVRRLQLDAGDASLWLGMLRQIAWKLGAQK